MHEDDGDSICLVREETDEVDGEGFDGDGVVGEGIYVGLVGAPIVGVEPVGLRVGKPFVREAVAAVGVLVFVGLGREGGELEEGFEVVEVGVGDGEGEGFGGAGRLVGHFGWLWLGPLM